MAINKVAKWVGIGCGTFALLIAIGIGACLVLVKGVTNAPAETSHAFFRDLRGGNTLAAYARMSPTYQTSHPWPLFQQRVAQTPPLTAQTDSTFTQRSVNNNHASVSGQLTTAQGPVAVTVTLTASTPSLWVIDSVVVAGVPLQ